MRRVILVFILALACLVAGFAVGYFRGFSSAKRDDTVVGLQIYSSLFKFEQQGDTNRMADRIRFMIFGYSDYYDSHFSSETITSDSFRQVLIDARTIASQVRPHVVSVDAAMQQINNTLRTNDTK